jgi:hypothetical protein
MTSWFFAKLISGGKQPSCSAPGLIRKKKPLEFSSGLLF